MKYQDIRKFSYSREKKVLATSYNFDINNWIKSPYTCFKVRFYIELACVFVFILQYTNIKPNHISYLYAFSGIIAGAFLGSNNNTLLIIGIFLFFSKVALDGTDGLLARVKYKPTKFGALLDEWGGLVGEYGFLFGLGLYLFNQTGNENIIYITVATGFIKAIDIKTYGNRFLQNSKKFSKVKKEENLFYSFAKDLVKNGFNYHAKTVDLILLSILYDLYLGNLYVTHYFLYIYFVRGVIIFFGNLFIYRK
tara:strand:+ start:87 stop:839 length:753 start_codon:yes stop_codon:yes gene_type:complete